MKKEYITIYKDKNGEWDFGVSGLVSEIKKEEVKEFRSIIITAIYVAEDMLRRKWEEEQQASCKSDTDLTNDAERTFANDLVYYCWKKSLSEYRKKEAPKKGLLKR